MVIDERMLYRIAICLVIILYLSGCASIQPHGRLKAGIFPNHNEDISNVIPNGIEKYRIDFEQDYRYNRFEIGINPILHFAGPWPEQSRSYHAEYKYIEMRLIVRIYLVDNINIFAENIRYYAGEGIDCNCTYANQFGMEVKW